MRMRGSLAALAALFLALLVAACGPLPAESGRFEKTLTVSGPARLELENGSGAVHIRSGPAGQVRVEGEFRVQAWLWQDPARVAEEIRKSPPIEQHGNFVRIGRLPPGSNARVEYVVVVPEDTDVSASVGSGSLDVRGVRGPARLHAGSGSITAESIAGDVEAGTGSGSIQLRDVAGEARAKTGSGSIVLEDVRAGIRASTGSGRIRVLRPGGSVVSRTGSGDVELREARGDVQVNTASGDIVVEGNPAPRAYWDLSARSGSVHLDVPDSASFTFLAETASGRIDTDLPIAVTEKARRTLRGRVGNGEARVRAETSSGRIVVR